MKKKIVAIAIMAFLLTGCSVNYELDFNEKDVKEKINIKDTSSLTDEEEELFNSKNISAVEQIAGDEGTEITIDPLYKIDKKDNELNLEYTYDYNLLYNSELFSRCFDNQVFVYNNNAVFIEANNIVDECYKGPMTIKFKTDKLVDRNNADEVKGNEYIWNIDSQDDLDIEFSVILDQEAEKASIFTYLYKISIVVGLLAIIVFLIKLYKKISAREVGE